MTKKPKEEDSTVLQLRMPEPCKKAIRRQIITHGFDGNDFVLQLRAHAKICGFHKWVKTQQLTGFEDNKAFTLRMPPEIALEIKLEALEADIGQGEYFFVMFDYCMKKGFAAWVNKTPK